MRLGLSDHGKRVSDRNAARAKYELGYKYEIIDGRLYVIPFASLGENLIETWLFWKLLKYKHRRPDIIQYASNKARVFVPGHRYTTAPNPDIAIYREFPRDRPIGSLNWEDVSPHLVIEVLFDVDPHKDLVRNVALYHEVPSIAEYWIVDARDSSNKPTLIVHRRRTTGWAVRRNYFGDKYKTRLIPGFSLLIDPRR